MTTAEKLYDEAMALPDPERRELAEKLLRSLPDGITTWESELQRRMDEADADPSALVPWDEALDRIFGRSPA
ncbi:MAG: addiction module protein [Tepidiformaceae bacterium]